ncbi:hypothetical protein [Nocardioides sp.]|uniref:hypothetical protein n=1 Tax=Nocardioides sp. TaxID=35761 RepID=UPI002C9358AB|nr:hypothetical protein [Nocardioides sp.]HXH79052.1 hypothetical protein [Nocardioides sp.]
MGAASHANPTSRPTPDPQGVVVVLSPLQLMSHTVAAALQSRGLDAQGMSWAPGVRRALHELSGRDTVLLLDDLENRDSVLATRDLVKQSAARFLVLTHCPEGPAWGAVLASGAVGVVPVESSLAEVAAAVALVGRGEPITAEARRSHLEREWFEWLAEDTHLRMCLELVSVHDQALVHPPREAVSDQGPIVPRPRQAERDTVRH